MHSRRTLLSLFGAMSLGGGLIRAVRSAASDPSPETTSLDERRWDLRCARSVEMKT
jgi:hypothetical protein